MPKLTPQNERNRAEAFVNAYVEQGFNATQAAKAISKSTNANTLAVLGHEMLGKAIVQDILAENLSEARMNRDSAIGMISAELLKGALTADQKHKYLMALEKYTKAAEGAEQASYEAKLKTLLMESDLIEDFVDGKVEGFNKVFNPVMVDGKVIFDRDKKKREILENVISDFDLY
jgi:dihydroxyacetone kinase DhaKLM complex PTS-EIIA-like component DhaM